MKNDNIIHNWSWGWGISLRKHAMCGRVLLLQYCNAFMTSKLLQICIMCVKTLNTHGMCQQQQVMEIMMLRMSLLPKTLLPWILHHQTILCLETDTHHPLAELLEQLWKLQDKFACLKFATQPPTHMVEFMQLADKLQHLIMMLQPHPSPQPNEEPVHITVQVYTDTLHATQRETNLTTSFLQDIPMFDGKDSSKVTRLAHGPRNCHWRLNRKPLTSSWGQFMWPNPHSHLQGPSSKKGQCI